MSYEDCPFCGSTFAYLTQGALPSVKVLHPPIFFFTDAVVFIRPSKTETRKWLVAGAAGAIIGGGAVEALSGLVAPSNEELADAFNKLRAETVNECGFFALTYADVLAAFGEHAEMWPNSRVGRAALTNKKGRVTKLLSVTLTPTSGMKRAYDLAPQWGDDTKIMLTKAFGTRFQDER